MKKKVIIKFFLVILLFLYSIIIFPLNKYRINSKILLWSGKTKLRGINIWQKKIDPEVDEDFICKGKIGPPYYLEDFIKLRRLGVNYINISHPGIFNTDPPYNLNEDILNNLKNLVNLINQADMFCVISFRTGPGRSEYTFYYGEDYQSDPINGWFDRKYYNDDVWKSSYLQFLWAEMWKKTAQIFKDFNNVVGYDLMVEPNSNDIFFDINSPDLFYKKYKNTTYDWNQFYPKIVKAIREVDKKTPILISSMDWGSIKWLKYLKVLKEKNIVYTVHQYDPYEYTHNIKNYGYPDQFDIDYDGEKDKFNLEWLIKYLSIIKDFKNTYNEPVAVNEYGVIRWVKNSYRFLDDEMNIFENLEVNYAIWSFSTTYEPFRSEIDEFNYFFGINKKNKKDLPNNILLKILKKYWRKNIFFPSNCKFFYTLNQDR